MTRTLTTSAPGKLMLLGDHAVVYGEPCIVTAVNQRLYVTVTPIPEKILLLSAPDLGLEKYQKSLNKLGKGPLPKAVHFIEDLTQRFLEQYRITTGLSITTKSEFSSTFGFGSSSAVTVALAFALNEIFETNLKKRALFDLCYKTVLSVQGVGSGFDLAAALWGGTLLYGQQAKILTELPVTHLPIIVGYTGIKADTPTIVRQVQTLYQENPEQLQNLFTQMGDVVRKAQPMFQEKNWAGLGDLMSRYQKLLKQLHVSSPILDSLVLAAQEAGAWGAKLSGAGIGDCMVALASSQKAPVVKRMLTQAGGQVLPVKLNAPGAQVEG